MEVCGRETRVKLTTYESGHRRLLHRVARIHLYRYPGRLQAKAIYCDTYSVICIEQSDESRLVETVDKQEDMISELRPSESIVAFVSRGQRIMRTGSSIQRRDGR